MLVSALVDRRVSRLSGDGRSEVHRGSRRSEDPTSRAPERSGHADEHRTLAGDRLVKGSFKIYITVLILMKVIIYYLLKKERAEMMKDFFFSSPPRFLFRCFCDIKHHQTSSM